MQIVLPGALPDAGPARALIPHIEETAPTLVGWLRGGRARPQAADPATALCTPLEQWQLKAGGFTPAASQNLSAGLGPLWASGAGRDGQAVWLAELVHVSPSRDGAALLPASQLAISPEHSAALLESAEELFEGTPFTARPDSAGRWRIGVPADFAPACASPALVAITSVNDWWTQDLATRPWRKLVNELQMLWHDHPVNRERLEASRFPVNSLWLFGGARADQLGGPLPEDVQLQTALLEPAQAQDWGGWLAALGELEQKVFKPLAGRRPPPALVLLGSGRIVEVSAPPTGLLRWLRPQRHNAWRAWWSSQN